MKKTRSMYKKLENILNAVVKHINRWKPSLVFYLRRYSDVEYES